MHPKDAEGIANSVDPDQALIWICTVCTDGLSDRLLLLLFVRVLCRFQQFFSHITMVSGCDRELSAHFYSAASLKYHVPDTWHNTTPCHIILTLGRPVLALPRKSWVPSEEQLVPFLTTLVRRGPGSNPGPPVPQSGHSTYWAIGAGPERLEQLSIDIQYLDWHIICQLTYCMLIEIHQCMYADRHSVCWLTYCISIDILYYMSIEILYVNRLLCLTVRKLRSTTVILKVLKIK